MKKMIRKRGISKAAGLLPLLVLVIGLAVGVVALQSQKLLGSKAAETKPTCTGSWTCTKGASSYTYQCPNYAGGTEALCTGGSNGQGNYCNTAGGWVKTGGCSYSTGTIPAPTPYLDKLITPKVQECNIEVAGDVKKRNISWKWRKVPGTKIYLINAFKNGSLFWNTSLSGDGAGDPMRAMIVDLTKGEYLLTVKATAPGYIDSDEGSKKCIVK